MEIVRFVVGVLLPYVALGVFVGGMAYRFYSWKKLASPPMTLFPAPPNEKANTLNTIQEAVLFKSLFNGDRVLWAFAWAFHAVLLLIFIGHFRVFTNVDGLLMKLGMSANSIRAMSSGAGGAAGVAILLATVLLLARHLAVPRVREITGPADYLALLLIAAIIITGDMMRFGAEHFDLALTREYFGTLAFFGNVLGATALQNNVFLLHMCLALLLILCMPFSKILHFGGMFFTHQLIRRR
jgi:nitrate reductase gamma subunit